ncbi:MAG: hypothetical protein AB7O32_19375 [Vicinamibacterales bacterium]
MPDRKLTWMVAVTVLATVVWFQGSPSGQSASGSLVTSWGEADFQGVWTDPYDINLQRPAALGTRELYTDEEVAAMDRRRMGAEVRPRAERGSVADVAGAYDGVFVSVKPTGKRTSLIVDPPDGRIPPVLPAIQQRRREMRDYSLALKQHTSTCRNKEGDCANGRYGPPSPRLNEMPPSYSFLNLNRANGPEDRNSGERCVLGRIPVFDGYWRIVQSPGVLSIYVDVGQGQGFQRVVRVSNLPHLPSHVREPFGDARARWEGQTLVADITNFEPYSDFQESREHLHLIERWTRKDPKTLEYVVRIEDPTVWERPWTVRQELTMQDGKLNRVYYEPRCHEGNLGMVGLLLGARADEKAYAEKKGPHPASLDISSNSESLGTGINDPR